MSKINKQIYKYNYFYKITNLLNNHFYYGVHSTNDVNDGYMGSGVRLLYAYKKYGIENFEKEIIKYFDTQLLALEYEAEVVNETLVKDPNCYNISTGGISFAIGCVVVYDPILQKNIMVSKDDPRYINGELQHYDVGMVGVKDNKGNYFKVSKDDPRYISGELRGWSKGVTKTIEQRNKLSNAAKKNVENKKHNLVDTCILHKIEEEKIIKKRVSKNDASTYIANGWHPSSMSKTGSDLRWIHKDDTDILVKRYEVSSYLLDGWVIGHADINKSFNRGQNNPNYGKKQKQVYKINDDGTYTNKQVDKELFEEYIKNGWLAGHKYNKK